jgi:hypothetical protein
MAALVFSQFNVEKAKPNSAYFAAGGDFFDFLGSGAV